MKIGIVGLGLIGGSLCKAFKYSEKAEVFGYDCDPLTTQIALMSDFIDGELEGREAECDFIVIAVNAEATVDYVRDNATKFKKDSIVIDCCGVKGAVCSACFEIAEANGFHFIGGHPMAGTQFSGLKHSRQDLFVGQNMVFVPKSGEDMMVMQRARDMIMLAGFGSVSVTTAENHDKVIAFTSQLAHVVSNAYVKSPQAKVHKGFSAGSYKDLTRVAWLNERMWADLFLKNADNISFEIRHLINELEKYDSAVKSGDKETLVALLREGREAKERCDKR